MNYYLAPLEGITTYVYRNAFHRYFGPMDGYFTPFIVPHKDKRFNTRELKELSLEHNEGLYVVPQLLTNQAEDFLVTANEIANMGYREINLNLGCPSKTVVTKKKGSGFLAFPDELDRFLDAIFSKADFEISVKTRIGKDSADEFTELLRIYNQYPIKELTIHPRVQTDYYNNQPNLDAFEFAYHESKNPICYNGDIGSMEDVNALQERFPNLSSVMIGRGLIANPGMLNGMKRESLYVFHQMIFEEYIRISSGDRNVLFKMKELWFYMISLFEDAEKIGKKIKKCERLKEYEEVVRILFDSYTLRGESEC